MSLPLLYSISSVLAVSAVSLIGAFMLSFNVALLKRYMSSLVAFSTGAMLGSVFLHLLPEMSEHAEHTEEAFLMVLIGLLGSFVIEKFIHWRHCHNLDCKGHVEPVGPLILIGDAVHNVIDGVLIGTAYLVSIPLGIATTVAVFLHEIPQELGDFALLVHSGFSRGKALLLNFISALTALFGLALVLVLSSSASNIESILLPLAAGNFLYIAGSDLIPELHKETRLMHTLKQLAFVLAGVVLMWGLSGGGH